MADHSAPRSVHLDQPMPKLVEALTQKVQPMPSAS
jgi:hypothetical protein